MEEFDSLFADTMDDDVEFDSIFGSMEDGDLIDKVCGFTESGECETDFDELHQTADNATPDDIDDEVVGDEELFGADDPEGTDDEPAIDLEWAFGEGAEDECPKFSEIHQTDDDATPDDFEDDLTGETSNAPDDAEGTDDSALEMAFGEKFDIIHQTDDNADAKDFKDQVAGPEDDFGAKDPEGTDDDPAIDLALGDDGSHKDNDPDYEDIEGEFDKMMEETLWEDDDFEDPDYDNDSEAEFQGEDYEDDGLVGDDMDAYMDSLDADECGYSESDVLDPEGESFDDYTEEIDYEDGDESLIDIVAGHTSSED